ncbi:MFS transporter [Qaidamihabitans albus]|uniref:MFS transporter n=1 Tax=Qaidamihabitans albus TaxID=2795733 RepID=UPI001F3C3086|nr:MFS transporter [Qaidamihabitans albus]
MTEKRDTTGPAADRRPQGMMKVVMASLVGTVIEWYDFFLFGSVAALVFNKLFFPDFDPLVGTLLSLSTFAVGFVARPIGAVVFGHFGDIVGRKKMLVVSLLTMGGATVAVGLLPTYGQIGVAAPLLLVLFRLLQGFAVGGEWGGAVLMVSERGSAGRRGFWASWPNVGLPGGQVLSIGTLAMLATTMSDEAFLSWGWRLPFLLSGILVVVGLYIRISIDESPVFKEAKAAQEAKQKSSADKQAMPALQVLRYYWREVLLVMGARFCENVSGYIFTVFLLTYVTEQLGLDRQIALNAVLIGSVFHMIAIPFWGALSDRFGRRPIYAAGATAVGIWGFVVFPLADTGSSLLITVAVSVALVCHGGMLGPQGAFFSEMFGTTVRYSGASIGVQFASIFGGSLAPIIAVALLARFGSSIPVSGYVALTALVTVGAVFLTKETARRDLSFDRGRASTAQSVR